MRNWITRILIGVVAVCALAADARPDAKVLAEWNFDSLADAWTANSSVKDLAVRDGCLCGRSVGRDPVLVGPLFEIPADTYQYVEIRMRSTASGTGELFWTNTTEDPYGGFRSQCCQKIEYMGGDFHTYRVFPFWQDLGKVIRLRLDPPEDAEFALDYIRIAELPAPASKSAVFDFTKPGRVWLSADDPQPSASPDGISLSGPGEKFIISPKLDLDSESYPWLGMMIRSGGADYAVFQWLSSKLRGLQSLTVPLKPDDAWHVYNIPTEQATDWLGRIQVLALRISPAEGRRAEIRLAGAGAKPMGQADLDIKHFGFKDTVNRAGTGKPAVVQARIANAGGEPARDISAVLKGVPAAGASMRTIARLKPGQSKLLTWKVKSPVTAGTSDALLDIQGESVKAAARATLRWDPPVRAERSAYVPEPQPVRGEYEVGIYYYPGWHTYTRWSVLDDFPERRPVLGYYPEGAPEVTDWEIKWMVEHGITFIVYDWYWSAGSRILEHGIHQGYFNARYRDKIKFCLLWANHNPPGTASAEDVVAVTNYWLDNYFLRPEYFKIGGKPVVIIFSPHRLTEDMGPEAVRQAFDKSREMAKARGLPGIYFAACMYPVPAHSARVKALEQEGYDALTGYNYPWAGDKGRMRAPYDDLVTGYQEFWNLIADSSSLRYIPVTEPGWDSRPWDGPNARVRTGKTPAKFRKMLENAKQFVERRNPDAEPKVVLIEAWNEFGEGDYVEPHKEYGFEYLDAIREAFTSAPAEHADLVPQDVGLGPYDLPKPNPVTAWEFDDPNSPGWDAVQALARVKVADGCLTAVSTGKDPAFYSASAVDMDGRKFSAVEIRMRVDKGARGQLYWAGTGSWFAEPTSMKFDLVSGGDFHIYRLDLASSPAWKSRIVWLRLDPTDNPAARIDIDYIRFVPRRG